MDGNVESAMALGYHHIYSSTGGSTLLSDLIADDKIIPTGYVAEIFLSDARVLSMELSCHGTRDTEQKEQDYSPHGKVSSFVLVLIAITLLTQNIIWELL